MTMRRILVAPLVLAIACAGSEAPADPPSTAGSDEPVADRKVVRAPLLEGMGDHHRPVDTDSALAQRLFDQGLVLHYGFNHAEAARSFREAARIDPECAMCAAGVALTLGPNINAPRDPSNVAEAYAAIERAQALAGGASDADAALIDALATRWEPEPRDDRSGLDRAYADALAAAAETFPDDHDIASLHAEAMMVLHPWDYWAEDGEAHPWTPAILDTLEGVLEAAPDHPFANHLYIHAVEASDTPERGMASAERLEELVPGAGHLVHMPAHIYIRTGTYAAASAANERAIDADEAYLAQVEAQGLYPLAYYPHNYHFLWATTTLEGRSARSLEAARAVAARADRQKMREPGFGTLQHYLSIPYYALVAFGHWDAALEEPAPPEDLLYPTTVWQYMRGMALAATGELARARAIREQLEAAADAPELTGVTIWDLNATADLVRIAEAILAGRIAESEERMSEAIAHYRRAVELEDALHYDEPPPWGPATRRYLGRALVRAERFAEAESAYREDLRRFPENGWSLFGLAQALSGRDETEEAAAVRDRFEVAWSASDVELEWSTL